MKVDMSPKAIENRLKLMGQLYDLSLSLRRGYLKTFPDAPKNSNEKLSDEIKSKIQNLEFRI